MLSVLVSASTSIVSTRCTEHAESSLKSASWLSAGINLLGWPPPVVALFACADLGQEIDLRALGSSFFCRDSGAGSLSNQTHGLP